MEAQINLRQNSINQDKGKQNKSQNALKRATKKEKTKGHDIVDKLLTYIIIILLIVTLGTIAFKFSIGNASVVGQSMEDTLHNNDALVIDKVSPRFHWIDRNDIVILKEETVGDDQLIVKRVIGVAGDKIAFTDEGAPIVNDSELSENYIKKEPSVKQANFKSIMQLTNQKYGEAFDVGSPYIPEGYVFVMGDNRNNSSDSRSFGLFKLEDITGKVIYNKTNATWY